MTLQRRFVQWFDGVHIGHPAADTFPGKPLTGRNKRFRRPVQFVNSAGAFLLVRHAVTPRHDK